MILVLILLGILIFLLVLILVLIMSTLKIEVKQLDICNTDEKLLIKNIDVDYDVQIGIYLFNKIKIFWVTFNKKHIQRNKILRIFKMLKLNDKNIKNVVKQKPKLKDVIKALKILNPRVEEINLDILFDIEDVILTTAITTFISSVVGVIFAKVIDKFDKKRHSYKVRPIYSNKNIIKINLNCIICIKMVHIIYIIYIVLKRKERIKNGRTSNTRNDDNSNGKYQRYGRREHNYR